MRIPILCDLTLLDILVASRPSIDGREAPIGLLTQARLSLCARGRTDNKQTRKGEPWLTLEAAFVVQSNWRPPVHRRRWVIVTAVPVAHGPADQSTPSACGSRMPCASQRGPSMWPRSRRPLSASVSIAPSAVDT